MMARLACIASLVSLVSLTSACTYEDGRHRHGCIDYGSCPENNPPETDVADGVIDTGSDISVNPGSGAGAFIEYDAGGGWHVYTTCDTAKSDVSCLWDIIVSTERSDDLLSFDPESLGEADSLDWYTSRGVRLVAETTTDVKGLFLEAAPGATVRVDVYLDDAPAPEFIYWIGGGGLHQGSPTNPIDLTPTSP